MHGSKTNIIAGSKTDTAKPVRGSVVTTDADGDPDKFCNDWFVNIAKGLYQKDAGFALHLATGFEERGCYRYAAGDSRPPGYLLYIALRSDHGEQWLNGIMAGSKSAWWLQLQRDRQQAAAARAFVRGMESM